MRGYLKLITTAIAIAAPIGSRGAEEPLKIGLALSGGGARGLAHIGVLKVLEEEGLQASVITGTSMGSIIGGLYAAGYSPAFLEDMALGVDWFEMFRETVDRRYITMRQKSFRDRYLVAFPIAGGRLTLPSGIIKGQKIHRLLYELCWPVAGVEDFRELPRSFSCVATDIATGEGVVLGGGNLADAMRTSMAIPSVFTPVERDGRLLVDGGLVRNLPASDAIDLGADIVICIDVSSDLVGKDSLKTVIEIADQMVNVLMRSTLDPQRAHCDLYIRPELRTVGTLDFGDVPLIIEWGEKAARDHIEEIRAIVEAAGGYRRPPVQMNATPASAIQIDRIRYEGLEEVPADFVASLLGLKPPAAVTASDIDEGLRRLYSSGCFSRISYRFERSGGGRTLVLDIKEEGSDYIGLGLRYDTRWSFSALVGGQWKNLIGHGSTLNLDMILGRRVNILGMYKIDAGMGRWLMPGIICRYVDDYIEEYAGGQRTARWGVRSGRAGLLAESSTEYWFRSSIAAGGEWYSIRPDVAPAGSSSSSGGLVFVGGDFWIDTLDRSWMPRKGVSLKLSGQFFPEAADNDDSYYRACAKVVAAVPLHERLSLAGTFDCGLTGGGAPLTHHRYYLGGIMSWFDFYGEREISLYGYSPFEFSGANACIAGADLQFSPTARWLIAVHFAAGAAEEERRSVFMSRNAVAGWAGTVAYDTPAGPAELTVSGSEGNSLHVWFGFGYRF
jgi:NTE family protein